MTRIPRRPINTLAAPAAGWGWITRAAFVLGLAVVIARMTTLAVLRQSWQAVPGGLAAARGPGPASGLVFDLIAIVPALLVLGRRAVDDGYRLCFRWSHLPLLALAAWAALSTAWSSDRFAAAVSAADFAAAAVLLWAMSQVVRSWDRFRAVAAVTLGLLLVLFARSVMYSTIEAGENAAYWAENKDKVLRENGWTTDSFAARQFELKLLGGEQVGFFDSANTLASVTVLLLAASVGLGLQRVRDGDDRRWLVLSGVAVVAAMWLLVHARSKTAAATPVLGTIVVAAAIRFAPALRRHPTQWYFAGVAVVGVALAAVLGYGVRHDGLFPGHFSNSLDFRWKYWTASAGVFREHPLAGVGWANFGRHYLAHRRPEAAEEIHDPHNFLVRFGVELGVVGGGLVLAWLLRCGWEVTRPTTTPVPATDGRPLTFRVVLATCLLGTALGVVAGNDWSQGPVLLLALLITPLGYALVLLIGSLAGSMRTPQVPEVDDRPFPWVWTCTAVGLGLFLLHNLIDFGWFEPGPMALFMALTGSTLGLAPEGERRPAAPRSAAVTGVAVAAAAWLAVAGAFVGPVVVAESDAVDADDAILTAPADDAATRAAHFRRAAQALAAAAAAVPYNADYLIRQARAELGTNNRAVATSLIRQAERVDPLAIEAYLLDANLALDGPSPDAARVRADFDTILGLNPNDGSLRQQYGRALGRLGAPADARAQYRAALAADAALPAGEPRRFKPAALAELRELAGP